MTLSKKKFNIQKITDCIRSNSEKRDSKNKQKICVQVFKPAFHEKYNNILPLEAIFEILVMSVMKPADVNFF